MTAPNITTEFLDGKVRVTALSLNEVAIVAGEQHGSTEPLVVNRIPVEMRIYFKRRENGSWYSTNFFCYRLDNEHKFHPQRPATEGQTSKIYRAAVELCEELNETFLREGEVGRIDHEIAVVDDRIQQYEDERKALVLEHERERDALRAERAKLTAFSG